MKINYTDIKEKKEFTYQGDTLKQIDYNPDTNRYVYGRFLQNGKLYGYEIVQSLKRKNPDGTIVYCYPSTEQFGKNGWFVPVGNEKFIKYYVDGVNKTLTKEEYLKSLKPLTSTK